MHKCAICTKEMRHSLGLDSCGSWAPFKELLWPGTLNPSSISMQLLIAVVVVVAT